MKSRNIYIFGNLSEPSDRPAVSFLPRIQKEFPLAVCIHADPTEEWVQDKDTDLLIIDTVHGISHVSVFTDLTVFRKTTRNSVHDFDLSMELPLLLKLHRIHSVKIIGVPEICTIENETELISILHGLLDS